MNGPSRGRGGRVGAGGRAPASSSAPRRTLTNGKPTAGKPTAGKPTAGKPGAPSKAKPGVGGAAKGAATAASKSVPAEPDYEADFEEEEEEEQEEVDAGDDEARARPEEPMAEHPESSGATRQPVSASDGFLEADDELIKFLEEADSSQSDSETDRAEITALHRAREEDAMRRVAAKQEGLSMDMFDRSSDESSDDEWFKQLVGSDKREPKEEVRVVEDEATQGEIIDNMLDTMVDQLIEFEEAFEYVLDELLEKVVKRGEIQVLVREQMKRNDAEERKKQRILAKRRKHAKSGNGTALLDESDEEMDFTDGDDESVDSDEEWAMGVMKGGDWQSKTRGGLGGSGPGKSVDTLEDLTQQTVLPSKTYDPDAGYDYSLDDFRIRKDELDGDMDWLLKTNPQATSGGYARAIEPTVSSGPVLDDEMDRLMSSQYGTSRRATHAPSTTSSTTSSFKPVMGKYAQLR